MDEPKPAPAVGTQPLSLQAYERLRHQVVRLRLVPGQWVSERSLSAELGVGLAPLRSALTRLSLEGLLVTHPRRGYQVKPLTEADADQLFAAWRMIALEIVRLATLNMTPEAVEAYVTQVGARPADPDADELDVVLDQAADQWRLLARLAGNEYLADILSRLQTQISRLCALALSTNPAMVLGLSDQRESGIAAAFHRRDAGAAVALTEDVLGRLLHDLRQAFRNADGSTGGDADRDGVLAR